MKTEVVFHIRDAERFGKDMTALEVLFEADSNLRL